MTIMLFLRPCAFPENEDILPYIHDRFPLCILFFAVTRYLFAATITLLSGRGTTNDTAASPSSFFPNDASGEHRRAVKTGNDIDY